MKKGPFKLKSGNKPSIAKFFGNKKAKAQEKAQEQLEEQKEEAYQQSLIMSPKYGV